MITQHMSWVDGVDLFACAEGSQQPNLIIHVARAVTTPVGTCAAGMIMWQEASAVAPQLIGFVSENPEVGAYFGPHIFAGTPFENAPVLDAIISVKIEGDQATARVEVAGSIFECEQSGLGASEMIQRSPMESAPFFQQGLERIPSSVKVRLNGQELSLQLPAQGISGGPSAVVSPSGLYAR